MLMQKLLSKENKMLTIDCKNKNCNAIYHAKIKTFKTHIIKASCPFCGTKVKKKVGEEDE